MKSLRLPKNKQDIFNWNNNQNIKKYLFVIVNK